MPRILLVEDETALTDTVSRFFTREGYEVFSAQCLSEALEIHGRFKPDVCVLDVMLNEGPEPDKSGFDVCKALRNADYSGPVIFVTARTSEQDKLLGFELGADDYVTKPFDLRELLARIKAVLRRTFRGNGEGAGAAPPPHPPAPGGTAPAGDRCRFAGWLLDRGARRLNAPDGADVPLTNGEFELLSVFAAHPGRVLSRDFLLENTRGREAGPFDRTVDVQIGRLRKKIEPDPQDPRILKSVRGAGYILVAPVTSE